MFYVYAISSQKRKYIYVGLTIDLVRRLHEHNHGFVHTTRSYAPFDMLLIETLPNRILARQREKFWKTGRGKEILRTRKILNIK